MIRRTAAFLCLAVLCLAGIARAEDGRWLRAESAHFIVFSDGSERRLREAVVQLEGFDALLRVLLRQTEAEPGPKLEVYLLRNRAQLREIRPDVSATMAGFYAPRTDIIAAVAVFRDGGGIDGQEVLFHEYAHHFMFQHFANAYPAWFVEGFAEYVMTAEISPTEVTWGRYAENRAYWLVAGDWLSLERILRRDKFNREETASFYAQSWLMAHYLLENRERATKLEAYFARIREGADPVASFPEAFGVSVEEFDRELRRYVRGRITYHRITQAQQNAPSVTISRLPRAADELLMHVVRLRLGVGDEERAQLLAAVRRLAAEHPHDPFAVRALARAEITLGSTSAGRALLEPLLARDASDIEALYLTGFSFVVEARADEANRSSLYASSRRYFSRAFRVDQQHVPTLYRYAESFAAQGPMTPERLDVLVHAHNLAPQVDEISMNTALQLMAANRMREAAIILRPIASDPHGGETAEQARRFLEEAERGAGAEPEPAAVGD